jgi:chloramphenicol O-acetyltransferase type A
MNFKPIDVSQWKRREYFEHYLNQVPCTYSMTLNLDLTELLKELKKRDIKLYPTMIYLLSMIVNRYEEFRTAIDKDAKVGIFDFLHPSYTIFQKSSETFTNIWTEYTASFPEFYKRYIVDVKEYGALEKFSGKPGEPSNIFTVSSIPWVSFTGFNLNLPKISHYLLPIFTTGMYYEQNGKTWLPIAIQVHHAVCDGFHM